MIHIVGLGLGNTETLAMDALQAIKTASLIIGSQRQLCCVEKLLTQTQQVLNYPRPFANLSEILFAYIKENPQHDICLLASGDPLFYGISDFLLRHFSADQLSFYSNISSIQTAFSRIKKPWQEAKVISLHGRPLSNLIPHLAHYHLIALLTDQYSHPQAVANLLSQYGCENATVFICEALGTKKEKISFFIAKKLAKSSQTFDALHITIIEIQNNACRLPSFAGFDDTLFITDSKQAGKGMISKREIRLASLSLLEPKAKDIAWDIGAGCGAIAVEWAYWNQQGVIYAIEYHPTRLQCLKQNQQKFGVNNLHIIADKAPAALHSLPTPNAIFIGGSAGKLATILDYCWQRLADNGCMVINCVTENCKVALQNWLKMQDIPNHALDWTEIAVSKGTQLADQLLMRPRLPVRLLKISKRVIRSSD